MGPLRDRPQQSSGCRKSRQYGEGLDAEKIFGAFRQGEVFFHLTSFYRTKLEEEPKRTALWNPYRNFKLTPYMGSH